MAKQLLKKGQQIKDNYGRVGIITQSYNNHTLFDIEFFDGTEASYIDVSNLKKDKSKQTKKAPKIQMGTAYSYSQYDDAEARRQKDVMRNSAGPSYIISRR